MQNSWVTSTGTCIFRGPLDFKMDLYLVLDSNLQTLELYVSTLTPWAICWHLKYINRHIYPSCLSHWNSKRISGYGETWSTNLGIQRLLTYQLSYLLTVVIHLLANLFNCSLIVFMSFVNVRISEKNDILVVRRWHLMNLWHITQMVTLSSLLINTDTCWMVKFIAGNTIQRIHWHTD